MKTNIAQMMLLKWLERRIALETVNPFGVPVYGRRRGGAKRFKQNARPALAARQRATNVRLHPRGI